jgi:PmbA protein
MSDTHLLEDVVSAALKAGAEAAEAVVSERRSLSVTVRLGDLEEVEREESRDLGLRVFIGRRQATVSASDIAPATRARLVERAVAMAKLAPEDPYTGLAPAELLAKGPFPNLDLYDPTERGPEALEAAALAAEDAARAVPGVTNSEGGSGSWSTGRWSFLTSHGFKGEHQGSVFSLSAGVIAQDDGGMERGGEGRTKRFQADLPAPEALGRTAGERAVKRLGARKLDSRTAPVIFENRIAASLLSAFVGAISGPSIARGTSFLKDKLGQKVFSEAFEVVDDPFRPRGLGSAPFDDEGVTVERRLLVDKGVVTTWLLNCSAARQLGLTSTGHATRGLAGPPGVAPHNLHVTPGELDQAGLMRDAGAGLLITSMFSPSLNHNTGDWSAGVSGFWFEGGEIAYPVNEITVAGNLIDIYSRLVPGSDLEFRGSANAPSLMVDALAIAGR